MEEWSFNPSQQKIVEGAVADLYRAIGAGYSLMLPVRGHENTSYFDTGLSSNEYLEPNFWGGIQKEPNKQLANYYIRVLNELHDFMALSDEEKQTRAKSDSDNPFYVAYLDGLQMPNARWFTTTPAKLLLAARQTLSSTSSSTMHKKPDVINRKKEREEHQSLLPTIESSTMNYPDSYFWMFRSKGDALQSARALLNDYTKSNSALSQFFHGHWNRHHVKEVAKIVDQIDRGEINTEATLMEQLSKIDLVNPQGSLSRRIQFLKEQFKNTKEPTQSPTLD